MTQEVAFYLEEQRPSFLPASGPVPYIKFSFSESQFSQIFLSGGGEGIVNLIHRILKRIK